MIGTLIFEGLRDALPLIEKFAPSFGKLLHGTSNIAIGIALPLLEQKFNAKHGDISSIVNAITGDPEAADKLASLEQDHSKWIAGLTGGIGHISRLEINVKMDFDKTSNQ